jgi:penicillin-binding protein 1C
VRTLVMVTPHRFAKTLTALGLPLEQSGDYYGYSLALGSADVTLLSLTNAYRALANGGLAAPAADVARHAPLAQHRVFSADASYIIATVLSDNNARTRTFGFDSPLATRFFSAVKTGTSKDMRDNWTVGYTSRYTVGVWVGNADGQPMWDVSGVTGAAPIWAAIVGYLHRQVPGIAPRAPAGVVQTRVTFDGNIEPARNEWFVSGTQTPTVALAATVATAGSAAANATATARMAAAPASTRANAAPRIGSPADGTLFALDPDIPAARQRIVFERASGSSGRSRWRLDGKPLGRDERVMWLPWPGRHVLELVNADGSGADRVRFEVRGATARPSASPGASQAGAPKPGAPRDGAAAQTHPGSLTAAPQDGASNRQKL